MKFCKGWFAVAILVLMVMETSTSGDPCRVSSNIYITCLRAIPSIHKVRTTYGIE